MERDHHSTMDFGNSYSTDEGAILEMLGAEVTRQDVRHAVFSMGALKAPGLDGLNPLFFQNQWEIVGESLSAQV